ncbi:hypothetical protein JYT61_01100, partial [bacterium AH-315-E10]|nr:hypothetical protein [bacterium AH-315-E10]
NAVRSRLSINGKALCSKVGDLAELVSDIISSCVFDDSQRIKEILKMLKASKQSNIVPGGNYDA